MTSEARSPAFVADATVEVLGVSKWFGQKVAVSDVSCSFGPGVTGLLGPNGAGKTTLLRMLTGLILPSEGTVQVLGVEPRNRVEVYEKIGLVPEEDAVYGFLTAREFVTYAAKLSGVTDVAGEADRVLRAVEMTDAADRAISEYSKGMRQRTKVAAALIHNPQILVLDEPLNGTDPVQRAHLIRLFRELGSAGHTVIVSSHVLEEVQRMTDRVIAMVDGKLAAAGDVAAIRRAMTDIPYRVLIESDDSRGLATSLVGAEYVQGVRLSGDSIHIETRDLASLGTDIARVARDLDARITTFRPEDESLESVFRYLVRRR
ncbi:MAG TPA: ABC transporter ATP-binding protein [Acidimicrobiia bacterium]